MVNSDESMLNNHPINPTLELIDIDDEPDNHSRKDVSDFLFFSNKTVSKINPMRNPCMNDSRKTAV